MTEGYIWTGQYPEAQRIIDRGNNQSMELSEKYLDATWTKDVAREMANSLPGSPIVGYYNEVTKDFEEHNRIIDISGGKIRIKDTTRPYGFVDLGAKVWF
jgi:hypothetical protein